MSALRAVAATAFIGIALASCAAPASYMGISLASGATADDLQGLAQRAQAGDKQAQLALGIAYEEGRGVPVDLKRAARLYGLAAANIGGTTWVYAPSAVNGTSGRIIPVNIGTMQSGLPEARDRLSRLEARRK
jgi:hypothetical protein